MAVTPSSPPHATSSLALRFLGRRSVTFALGVTSALLAAAYLYRRRKDQDPDQGHEEPAKMTSKTEMAPLVASTPIKKASNAKEPGVDAAKGAFAKYREQEELHTSWVEEVEREKGYEEHEEQLKKETAHQLDESKLSSELQKLNIKDKMSTSTKATASKGKKNQLKNVSNAQKTSDSGVVSPTAEEDEVLAGERKPKSRSDSSDGGLGGSLNGEEDPERQAALSDSGQGSETAEEIVEYHFQLRNRYCGKFIGYKGESIKSLEFESKCQIYVETMDGRSQQTSNESRDPRGFRRVIIEGTRNGIDKCLDLIREKFPEDQFPGLTLHQINPTPQVSHQPTAKTKGKAKSRYNSQPEPVFTSTSMPYEVLADGDVHAVTVASIMSGNHITITFPGNFYQASLIRLEECMQHVYSQKAILPAELEKEQMTLSGRRRTTVPPNSIKSSAPLLIDYRPIQLNLICVALCDNKWYRVQVTHYDMYTDTVTARFLDYGGYATMAIDDLRQIRSDFTALPWLAIDVYLTNIVPASEGMEWSLEALSAISNIVINKSTSARMTGTAPDGIHTIDLYVEENGKSTSVSRNLVELGYARWVESGEELNAESVPAETTQ